MADMSNRASMAHLAHDHIITILHLLPMESIICFSMTCRRFKSIASSDVLWEGICRRDWGNSYVDGLLAARDKGLPWKNIYQQVYQLGFVSCIKLRGQDGIFPRPRASHSFNFISNCLVLFGGGCEGGWFHTLLSFFLSFLTRCCLAVVILASISTPIHSTSYPTAWCCLEEDAKEEYAKENKKNSNLEKSRRHLDDTWVGCTGNEIKKMLRWQQISSGTPSGRFGQTCTVVGDSLVLFGGINDHGVRQNDAWVGHVVHDESLGIRLSWRLLDVGSIMPPPRGAHAGCNVGDKRMVIHGGIGPDGLRLGDTWLLDLSEGMRSARWHEIETPVSPPARSGHTLTWIAGAHVILFGGRGTGYEVLNDLWLFDMGGEIPEWVELHSNSSNVPNSMPLPRVGHSATLILGGRVLIYGGEDSYRHRKDDFWVLDPSAIPTIRVRSQTPYPKMSSGKKMWRRLKVSGRQPSCRSFHRACVDPSGRLVYIFGGMVDGVVQPVESSGLRFDGELYLVELVLQL
ncbi:hypothetical protein ACLOJK_030801 [Asimina triloba]